MLQKPGYFKWKIPIYKYTVLFPHLSQMCVTVFKIHKSGYSRSYYLSAQAWSITNENHKSRYCTYSRDDTSTDLFCVPDIRFIVFTFCANV